MENILAEFLIETNDSLAKLKSLFNILEDSPKNDNCLREALFILHKMKGTSGFLGLSRVQNIVHTAEATLRSIHDKKITIAQEIIDAFYETIDHLKNIIQPEEIENPTTLDDDLKHIKELERFIHGEWIIEPNTEGGEGNPFPEEDKEEIKQVITEPDAGINKHLKRESKAAKFPPKSKGASLKKDQNTLNRTHPHTELLSNLKATIEKLMLVRNDLLQNGQTCKGASFEEIMNQLNGLITCLHAEVMKNCAQPIEFLFSKLSHVINDLGSQFNKKVNLICSGGETELDCHVLEKLEPLFIDMLKNAIQHGVETSEERQQAEKQQTATIFLKAYYENEQIVVELKDDGRGINSEKIKQKLKDKGAFDVDTVSKLNVLQLQNCIFNPGFSMNHVKKVLRQFGGIVGVQSWPGQGTLFTIKIPITYNIMPVLMVQASNQQFAMPQHYVDSIIKSGTFNFQLLQESVPLLHLSDVLKLSSETTQHAIQKDYDIVIVEIRNIKFGVVVDHVLDMLEIVLKPLSPLLENSAYFSGITFVGNGDPVLVIDLYDLLDFFSSGSEG